MKKQKNVLNCNQITKMIPVFITKKMPYKALEPFMEHIRHCDSCKEELSIQFLVNVGLLSLEDGDTFDLQTELNKALEEAYRRVRVCHFIRQSILILGIVAISAILILAVLLLIKYVYTADHPDLQSWTHLCVWRVLCSRGLC